MSTLLTEDIHAIALISCCIVMILILCWKECALYIFDPLFAQSLGFKTVVIEMIITVLLILAIVIGLQTVGVILMSTMLIAPAAAARQWVTKLSHMIFLSSLLGCAATIIGVYASSIIDHLPTGPAIVVAASCIVFFSLLYAPHRGVAWR